MTEKKNIIVLILIIIASISLFLATLKQPETAEGVGRGWD